VDVRAQQELALLGYAHLSTDMGSDSWGEADEWGGSDEGAGGSEGAVGKDGEAQVSGNRTQGGQAEGGDEGLTGGSGSGSARKLEILGSEGPEDSADVRRRELAQDLRGTVKCGEHIEGSEDEELSSGEEEGAEGSMYNSMEGRGAMLRADWLDKRLTFDYTHMRAVTLFL